MTFEHCWTSPPLLALRGMPELFSHEALTEAPRIGGTGRRLDWETQLSNTGNGLIAGPSRTEPSVANREPCSGQSQDFSWLL